MHVCIYFPGVSVCVCFCDVRWASSSFLLSFGCNCQFPPAGPIFYYKNCGVYTVYSVLHRERSLAHLQCSFKLSRHCAAWSQCGPATEDSVTNGNYICVFFMNPSNTGLLKMLPRYLRLSATSRWDQIGMLLRQSGSTHPLVSPVMCVTACVGKYHVLFNYRCTLSTVVDVLEIGQLQVQFGLCLGFYIMCILDVQLLLLSWAFIFKS